MPSTRPRKILFVSPNSSLSPKSWGGSEELWTMTVPLLAADGHRMAACFSVAPLDNRSTRRLTDLGVPIYFRLAVPPLAQRLTRRVTALWDPVSRLDLTERAAIAFAPDLVVINQGSNTDGIAWAAFCRARGWSYVMISQQASDMDWPSDDDLDGHIDGHTKALSSYFVSPDNLRITQEQIGQELTNARLVCNPFVMDAGRVPAWPGDAEPLQLAMVGRLHVNNKGHDILFRVLRQEKWRTRPLQVNLYGSGGGNERGLRRLKDYFGLENVVFQGQQDINAIWSANHALLMCSRKEGTPLVLIEGMMAGRMAIVTPCSGCKELVEDGVSGFMAADFSDNALDAVLERAWTERTRWREMGEAAASRVRELVPTDPAAFFKNELDTVLARLP